MVDTRKTFNALTIVALSFLGLLIVGSLAPTFSMAAIGIESSIAVGPGPAEMVFDTLDNSVFLITAGSGRGTASVTEINAASNSVIGTQKIVEPVDIVYNPTNDEVYVTSKNRGVSILSGETGKLLAKVSIATNDFQQDIAYDPANGNVYVADTNPGEVSVISASTNTVTTTVKTGYVPQHLAFDPADGDMYVFLATRTSRGPYVEVISSSTNEIAQTIPLPSSGGGSSFPDANLAYDPTSQSMFVSNGIATVFVLANEAVTATIPITAEGMLYDPANTEMYAVGGDGIYAISSSNSVVSNIPNSGGYLNLTYDPINADVYAGGSMVMVLSTANTLVASVLTGTVGYVLFNPAGNDVYASLQTSPGIVDVISSS